MESRIESEKRGVLMANRDLTLHVLCCSRCFATDVIGEIRTKGCVKGQDLLTMFEEAEDRLRAARNNVEYVNGRDCQLI